MAKKLSAKHKILDAAATCFARRGYFNTSVDEIVTLAGVAKGSAYYNFKSKEEILLGVIQWGMEIIEKETQTILDSGQNEETILRQIISVYVNQIMDYPELASVIFTSNSDYFKEEWSQKLEDLNNSALTRLADLLKEGAEEGFLKEMDYSMTAAGLLGLIWNCCHYQLKYYKEQNKESVINTLYDTFCTGIIKGDK